MQNLQTNSKLDKQTYLYVPLEQKEAAKSVGCRWDVENKAWYAPKGTELKKVSEWMLDNQELMISTSPILSSSDPLIDFQKELDIRGFELKAPLELTNRFNRVHIFGHKSGTRNGSYRIFSDDIPILWLKDWSTGIEESIPHKDTSYNPEISEKMVELRKEINRIRYLQHKYDKSKMQVAISYRLTKEYEALKPAASHPYTTAKCINPLNAKIDDKDNLVIAFRNTHDHIKTIQKIAPTKQNSRWSKYWEKNAEKIGNFAIIGAEDFSQYKKVYKNRIIVAEGYATAISVHEALKHPIIVVGDSSNLIPVISSLAKDLGNDLNIIIAADNDLLVKVPVNNPGLTYAQKAAKMASDLGIKTKIVKPNITEHDAKKGISDFNDLAALYGSSTVKKQILTQLNFNSHAKKKFDRVKDLSIERA
ncbi:MAG: DUF5710 domain-containing protein [Sulfurimonas sp.]|jgi:phage/plasmid primase-like uncharacterized protein|uniref:DUF5710 domain-containing protein n=1 Tax=Sulfurimonas sp. TaxID=2022749 RepID=UPI003564CDB3